MEAKTLLPVLIGFLCTQLIEVVGQQCTTTVCPNGWVTFNTSCYLFEDNIKLPWPEAAHLCSTHKAHLAYVESAQESQFLKQFARRFSKGVEEDESNFWIGLKDDDIDGIWLWYDIDLRLQYSDWSPDEPQGGLQENCVFMYGPHKFKWDDAVCSWDQHFVCEKR